MKNFFPKTNKSNAFWADVALSTESVGGVGGGFSSHPDNGSNRKTTVRISPNAAISFFILFFLSTIYKKSLKVQPNIGIMVKKIDFCTHATLNISCCA
jgi:hypothetical protein